MKKAPIMGLLIYENGIFIMEKKKLHFAWGCIIFLLSSGPAAHITLMIFSFDDYSYDFELNDFFDGIVTAIVFGSPPAFLTWLASIFLQEKYSISGMKWIISNMCFGFIISFIYLYTIFSSFLIGTLKIASAGAITALIASLLIIYIVRRVNRQK